MKLYIYTLGCRVNQCESEAIAQAFEKRNHEILMKEDGADLIIVNTCTVTSKAEQKARRVIRAFSRICPVFVTGCYAQMNGEEIRNLGDNIYVLDIIHKATLLSFPQFLEEHPETPLEDNIKLFIQYGTNISNGRFDYAPRSFSYHVRSYLKVQDGCDNNCGFCRVHIARGPSVSLEAETVVQRALELEKSGYHEIVLTGVNLTMYDHDGEGLGGLLEKLLAVMGPDVRFRLSSMEPDHIDDRLLKTLYDPRMQPYFHIPIQSAADKVIKRINRHYDSQHLEYVIQAIREIKQDPFLACDVITGLPAEGEEEFEITRSFLERHSFAQMHVFPFSPRPDTDLYLAKDKVPESIRDERARILRELSAKQKEEYTLRQIGRDHEVILEDRFRGRWFGLTGNYLKVQVNGVPDDANLGEMFKVRLTEKDKAVLI